MTNTFHKDVWDMERAWGSERNWMRYTHKVESLMQIDCLDGDEWDDGYSLDSAYAAFRGGISAEDYASGIRVTIR